MVVLSPVRTLFRDHPTESMLAMVLSVLLVTVVFIGVLPATDALSVLSPSLLGLAVGVTGVVSFLMFARLATFLTG